MPKEKSMPRSRGFKPMKVGYTPNDLDLSVPRSDDGRALPKAPEGGTGEVIARNTYDSAGRTESGDAASA